MTTLRTTLALIESAVLAPLYRDADGRLRLVFIRRSPFGRHGGQIAFPGGRREPEDPDLLTTALREAEEEIGLARQAVDVLAALPIVDTATAAFGCAVPGPPERPATDLAPPGDRDRRDPRSPSGGPDAPGRACSGNLAIARLALSP